MDITGKYARLSIKPKTKKMLMCECKTEFLRLHPEFSGFKITEDFILRKICEYYLKT